MALTNWEKNDLRQSVKRLIAMGYGEKAIIERLSRFGQYKKATIKKYYRVFRED